MKSLWGEAKISAAMRYRVPSVIFDYGLPIRLSVSQAHSSHIVPIDRLRRVQTGPDNQDRHAQ